MIHFFAFIRLVAPFSHINVSNKELMLPLLHHTNLILQLMRMHTRVIRSEMNRNSTMIRHSGLSNNSNEVRYTKNICLVNIITSNRWKPMEKRIKKNSKKSILVFLFHKLIIPAVIIRNISASQF